jgi:hypothetical protein
MRQTMLTKPYMLLRCLDLEQPDERRLVLLFVQWYTSTLT